jgi:unsaturated rhamnogalacturonyl hydrolase
MRFSVLRRFLLLIFLFVLSCHQDDEVDVYFETLQIPESGNVFTKLYIKQLTQAVANWQGNHLIKIPEDNDWARATFLLGIISAYKITQDSTYLTYCFEWANRNKWELSKRTHTADKLLCGKVYLELMELMNISTDKTYAIREEVMRIRNANMPGSKEWYWSDALFMAPPSIVHFHRLIDPNTNYDLFYDMWWDAHAHLYSLQDSLYYRDERFFKSRIFWARGNGWVVASMAKIMEQHPVEHPEFEKLSIIFNEVAEKLKSIQNAEGLWFTSLLQADKYPSSETSGSALICYALAWGINHGVLKKEDYEDCVKNAWQGIVNRIHSNGKVGWVQARGDRPVEISSEDFQEYGTGAVLLAAEAVYKFAE